MGIFCVEANFEMSFGFSAKKTKSSKKFGIFFSIFFSLSSNNSFVFQTNDLGNRNLIVLSPEA